MIIIQFASFYFFQVITHLEIAFYFCWAF